MSEQQQQPGAHPGYTLHEPKQDHTGLKFAILFGAVLALIVANFYLFKQIENVKLAAEKDKETLVAEISRTREGTRAQSVAAQRNIDTLKEELDAARRQASMAVGQAKDDATRKAEQIAARLEASQKAAEQAVRSEISKVEQAANTKAEAITSEVSGVKTEVAKNKSEIDKTLTDLKSVRGDLGVQSGLIATNSKELAALRALGERNYFEFSIVKSKQPSRVGDIMVQLKKADEKKNRYTVDITADDKKVEKKDKTVNEPIQFYTAKARQPYEIVVNSVTKDRIAGYLATPKVTTTR